MSTNNIDVPINGTTPVPPTPTYLPSSGIYTYDGSVLTCDALGITINSADSLNSALGKIVTGLCSTKTSLNTLTTTVTSLSTQVTTNTTDISDIQDTLAGTFATSKIAPYDGTAVSNYTPTANTLNGYLKGIDNKFGTLVGGGATKQDIYDNTKPLMNNWVVSGLVPSTTGANAKSTAGAAYINGHYVLTASTYDSGAIGNNKDAYVYLKEDATFGISIVANGGSPTIPSDAYNFAKFVTNGSGAVTVNDTRNYTVLKNGTVTYTNLDTTTQYRTVPPNVTMHHTLRSDGTSFIDAGASLMNNGTNVGVGVAPSTERLTINGAINIGDANGTDNGTIKYVGGDFSFRRAGSWVNLSDFVLISANALNDMTDVNITSPNNGDTLNYQSGEWVNTTNGVLNVMRVDSDTTIDGTQTMVAVDKGGGNIQVTIPNPADVPAGKFFYIYDDLGGGTAISVRCVDTTFKINGSDIISVGDPWSGFMVRVNYNEDGYVANAIYGT